MFLRRKCGFASWSFMKKTWHFLLQITSVCPCFTSNYILFLGAQSSLKAQFKPYHMYLTIPRTVYLSRLDVMFMPCKRTTYYLWYDITSHAQFILNNASHQGQVGSLQWCQVGWMLACHGSAAQFVFGNDWFVSRHFSLGLLETGFKDTSMRPNPGHFSGK